MTGNATQRYPASYALIDQATRKSGFTMASDVNVCSLLKTLAASKPGGKFLELGTGTGLSTSWILDGMNASATLISVDNDPAALQIAKQYLGNDHRLKLAESDGARWIEQNKELKFDFIFADTWHGKYLMLEEVLNMLNPAALYIVDDMLPQENWPDGHHEKVTALVKILEDRNDLLISKLHWSTGVIIAVKHPAD
ncbi:class I SAM-dependent methyltransferase [Flavitalea sp. BT771]|uniref:O-methyltransferase n=1 Tax=Flavitalea sp. BT771 TaxID=3063329 RepID=UPI0026E25FFD|nr:class I SAM-dependent methyltransferase [Flavitalea sp. BT771]MDO6429397.1 class I SAM-dependent methyltransferase [Flavitalea sp. BT771]MDV6218475.1 class I SAM-dependent methyltransferase [Flavitalea sp. BT771]